MASFFQKKFRCFYCGCYSKLAKSGAIRRWKCEGCQAVNYLDENGEITDPPVNEASQENNPPKYAQPLSRPTEPEAFYSDSSIFCSTCLKNQHLFTHTLASYLPAPSDPEYAAYEASYPQYRESLEQRYPQVCKNCEPRVADRIRQTGYEAKADHLRRMMERSRGGRLKRDNRLWRWKSLWVSTGAVAFWTSVAGQLVWDAVESVASDSLMMTPDVNLSESSSSIRQCILQYSQGGHIPRGCAALFQPYAGISLILGIFSLWWNPKLRYKVNGYHGRLIGLREYYRIQLVVLVVRFVAWAGSQDPTFTGHYAHLIPAIHIFTALFTVISTFGSRAAIRFDKKPLVNWNDNADKLLGSSQKSPAHAASPPLDPQYLNTKLETTQNLQRFPVANLAPQRPASPEPYIPPTPPPDPVDDADAMDWTPSQKPLKINHVDRRLAQTQAIPDPSLFQGYLPSAPKPPSWQLRNPNPGRRLRPIEDQPNPFHKAPVLQPPSTSDKEHGRPKSTGIVMAPPRFFPPGDVVTDTGLENLFDKAFSIADGPSKAQMQQSVQMSDNFRAKSLRHHILKACLLFLSMALWAGAQLYAQHTNSVDMVVLGVSFVVAGFSLLESLMRPMVIWSATDILISLLELTFCMYLAIVRTRGLYVHPRLDNANICLAAFMMGQELFAFRPSAVGQQPVASGTERRTKMAGTHKETIPAASKRRSQPAYDTQPINNIQSQPTMQARALSPLKTQSTGFNTIGNNPSFPTFDEQDEQSQTTPTKRFAPPLATNSDFFGNEIPLSFNSSFSIQQERASSPTDTASIGTRDYTPSLISEPPSPIIQPRTPGAGRSAASPSIMRGLSLDDRPVGQTPRYSLRNRRKN